MTITYSLTLNYMDVDERGQVRAWTEHSPQYNSVEEMNAALVEYMKDTRLRSFNYGISGTPGPAIISYIQAKE